MRRMERELVNECYLISKGVRSCAQMTVVGVKDINEECPCITDMLFNLEQVALRYNLQSMWFKYKDQSDIEDGFEAYSFWVYRYPHQLVVIRTIEEMAKHSFLVEWMTGKLLGYSDASMEKYLSCNIMNNVKADTTVLEQD